jgi:SAM-dependent methyltransferase
MRAACSSASPLARLSCSPRREVVDMHDHYGNPEHIRDYIELMEGADRAAWQKPDEVIAALALRPRHTVAEIGAGPGYFSLRIARAAGHVFAAEADPRMLPVLRDRIAASGARNVTPVFALREDPLLPARSCDLILMVNTFHHMPSPAEYLRRLAGALKSGGRLANIDFVEGELPVGPDPAHKISREQFLRVAEEAGFALEREETFLLYQYFLVLRKTSARAARASGARRAARRARPRGR